MGVGNGHCSRRSGACDDVSGAATRRGANEIVDRKVAIKFYELECEGVDIDSAIQLPTTSRCNPQLSECV